MNKKNRLVIIPIALLLLLSPISCSQQENSNPPVAFKRAPVKKHGALKVKGRHLVDESGKIVTFKGMSLYWSQLCGSFWSKNAASTIIDQWGSTVIRAAMGVEPNGYLVCSEEEERKLTTIVNTAIERDTYVIIDWHDHDAIKNQKAAICFFKKMAKKYKNTPHVLFEIYNEPVHHTWHEIKEYAEVIIKTIRDEGANNIIIVGTPTWSQDVDIAAKNPITEFENIMYALHFYAGTHQQDLRIRAEKAINSGLPIFISEWGLTASTGKGKLYKKETLKWIAFMEKHKLSWCNWSFSGMKESSSVLKPESSLFGPWCDNDLKESGKFLKEIIAQ